MKSFRERITAGKPGKPKKIRDRYTRSIAIVFRLVPTKRPRYSFVTRDTKERLEREPGFRYERSFELPSRQDRTNNFVRSYLNVSWIYVSR